MFYLTRLPVFVDGVQWWGLVEKDGPYHYNWSAYEELVSMLTEEGLKFQCVFSFHQAPNCKALEGMGLPPWVLEVARNNPEVLFTDRGKHRSWDSLSFSVDDLELFDGRSAMHIYKDFMLSFRNKFDGDLGGTIAVCAASLRHTNTLHKHFSSAKCPTKRGCCAYRHGFLVLAPLRIPFPAIAPSPTVCIRSDTLPSHDNRTTTTRVPLVHLPSVLVSRLYTKTPHNARLFRDVSLCGAGGEEERLLTPS